MIQCKSMIFLVYIRTSKFNQSDWRISIMWSKLTNHKARIFVARNLPKNQQTMEYPAIWLVEFALKKKLKWKFLKIPLPVSSDHPSSHCHHPPPWVSSWHTFPPWRHSLCCLPLPFCLPPPYDHPSLVTLPFSATYLCQRLSFNLFAAFTYLHIHLLSLRGYEPVPTCIRLPHVPEEPVPCYSSQDLSPRRVTLLFSTLPQVSARLVSSCTLGPSNCAS